MRIREAQKHTNADPDPQHCSHMYVKWEADLTKSSDSEPYKNCLGNREELLELEHTGYRLVKTCDVLLQMQMHEYR